MLADTKIAIDINAGAPIRLVHRRDFLSVRGESVGDGDKRRRRRAQKERRQEDEDIACGDDGLRAGNAYRVQPGQIDDRNEQVPLRAARLGQARSLRPPHSRARPRQPALWPTSRRARYDCNPSFRSVAFGSLKGYGSPSPTLSARIIAFVERGAFGQDYSFSQNDAFAKDVPSASIIPSARMMPSASMIPSARMMPSSRTIPCPDESPLLMASPPDKDAV